MRYRKPIFDYYKYDYNELWKTRFFEVKTLEEQVAWLRYMFLNDLFFMMYYGFNRADVNGFDDPFILQACRMLEDGPVTDTVDLWARGFYKSSTQTQAHTLQDILKASNKTAAIFSHTRPIAKAFLIPIKGVLESSILLKFAFPDILWANPKRDAPIWSLDEGLELKRDSVSNTRSIEAWGLVDGMPTALDMNTVVLTSDGWKTHGSLVAGDMVFGSNGEPIKVIHNTGVMCGKECYRVHFDDIEIVAAADHLWPVDRCFAPRDPDTYKQDTGWNITKREIVKTIDLPIKHRRLRSPSTPIIHPSTNSVQLELEPFLLGLWLGDGSSDCGIITTMDESILDEIKAMGFKYEIAQDRGNYKMYRILGLREILKSMGLLWNKHIPDQYFMRSQEDRLALLQGLMDSDGSCRLDGKKFGGGQCTFTNTNYSLATGVHYLAASLGLKPSRIRCRKAKNSNHNDQYIVQFLGIKSIPPFRLERKLERCKDQRYNGGRYVKKLEKIDSVPVNCIQVNAQDGIYLAGKSLVPTHNSKHFDIRVYDDVVTEKTATSPDMIQKAEDAFRLSDNLGTPDGWQRIVGTNYSHGDFYSTIEAEAKNGTYPWKIRKHPWFCEYYTEEDIARLGIPSDYIDVFGYRKPRLLTWQQALKKRKKQNNYIWACQMELNPSNRDNAEFKREWLKRYRELPSMLSKYLFVDPANEKKKTSDFTAMALIGIDCFGNRFLVDMLRDKLNLGERWKAIKKMVNDNDGINCAYYEKYGKDSDIWYMQQRQLEEGCYFPLEAIGGVASKNDRIRDFIPTCENGKFFIPEKPITYHGRDLVREFIDQEYSMWPFCKKKDMIDCISRVEDPEVEIVKPLPNMTQGYGQAESLMDDYYETVSCDEQI